MTKLARGRGGGADRTGSPVRADRPRHRRRALAGVPARGTVACETCWRRPRPTATRSSSSSRTSATPSPSTTQLVAGLAAHLRDRRRGQGRPGRHRHARNYPEWTISFWATISLGAVAVPLNAWWTGPELEYALGRLGRQGRGPGRRARWSGSATGSPTWTAFVAIVSRHRGDLPAGFEPWDEVRAALDLTARAARRGRSSRRTTPRSSTPPAPRARPKGALATHRNHCTNIMNTAFVGALAAEMAGAPAAPAAEPPQPASLQVFPFFHIGGLTGMYVSTAFGLQARADVQVGRGQGHRADLAASASRARPSCRCCCVSCSSRRRSHELDSAALAGISSGGASVPPDLIRRMETRVRRPGGARQRLRAHRDDLGGGDQLRAGVLRPSRERRAGRCSATDLRDRGRGRHGTARSARWASCGPGARTS